MLIKNQKVKKLGVCFLFPLPFTVCLYRPGGGKGVTPTPVVMPTPTLTVSPTAAPSLTPTATPIPAAIPTPTATPIPAAIPTPTATPIPAAIPTPTATPTGFEVLFSVVGLIAVAYLVLRRKRK